MKRKGQSNMMEHMLVIFFVVVVILVLIIMLTNFQFAQLENEKKKSDTDRAFSLVKRFTNSQYIAKKESVLEDAKLTAMLSLSCQQMESVFGASWFMDVVLLDGSGAVTQCSQDNYPDCNYWRFSSCSQEGGKNVSYVMPVNIYSKMFERMDIGTIRAGVYI